MTGTAQTMSDVNAACGNQLAHTHTLPDGFTWLHNATRTPSTEAREIAKAKAALRREALTWQHGN